ncbi:outer membrane protein assembly factor BamE [Nitrosospira sp. Nl5]|uniref:outer membrane protein assembly factor BamE n=1 Tax=Nitrosospira sp. Nl5 TaxID=200120 RepID=UPI000889081F|nr:outer membrane protein assembly factor BamE [Nitrosospira sp. Nl5]SCY35697.1 outer membrane protein assembly factor BamE [Nitrosospira sp. Nl5]
MRAKILTLLVLLLLAGCSSVPSLLYKIEIQQGNLITQELVDKLKPGMTRAQVRFVLGSPMISDAFHENRWDYVYRLEQKGNLVEQRHLTVFFEEDKLARIDGSFSPSIAFSRPQEAEPGSPIGESSGPVVKEESGTPSSGTLLPEPDMPSLRQTPSQATVLPQPAESIKPVIKEEGGIPASGGIAPPSDVAAPSSVSAGGAPTSSGAPVASQTPVSQDAGTVSPRRVPSQAADAGGKGADQPKE